MPVDFRWDDERKTIAIMTFHGSWTWDEYKKLSLGFSQEARKLSQPIYFIADLTESAGMPPNTLANAGWTLRISPENVKLTLIVGITPVIKVLYGMFSNLFPAWKDKFVLVKSMDEAYQIIRNRRI